MKAHILIVEDEAILYDRLQRILEKEHYTIDDYTPSVEDAIARIHKRRPDIVLLDIYLEGKRTGIDLGKLLDKEYQIPFIYVTGFDDDQTFYAGLHSGHEQFIVKTKPRLKPKEIIRAIQTVLQRRKIDNQDFFSGGIIGLLQYLDDLKDAGQNQITKKAVVFEDIIFFTNEPFINDNEEKEKLKSNYLWFQTKHKNEHYFFRSSLTDLVSSLPYHFVRINKNYIVSIAPDMFTGMVGDHKISIRNTIYPISERYRKEVKKRIQHLYKE